VYLPDGVPVCPLPLLPEFLPPHAAWRRHPAKTNVKAAQELRFFHRSRRKPTLPNSAIESSSVTANKPVALFPIKDARALPVFVFTIRVAVPLSSFSEIDPTAHVGAGEAVAVTLQLKDTSELLNPWIGETLIVEVDGPDSSAVCRLHWSDSSLLGKYAILVSSTGQHPTARVKLKRALRSPLLL
jgi:hypothetical protein